MESSMGFFRLKTSYSNLPKLVFKRVNPANLKTSPPSPCDDVKVHIKISTNNAKLLFFRWDNPAFLIKSSLLQFAMSNHHLFPGKFLDEKSQCSGSKS